MKYGLLFVFVSGLMLYEALAIGRSALWLLWPAASFGWIALGYLGLGARVCGKRADGTQARWAIAILGPYFSLITLVWHLARWLRHENPYHQLTNTLTIGRRLLSSELPDDIDVVIDLTCEFPEPNALRAKTYWNFPILDGSAPSPCLLRQWVNTIKTIPGHVYVHCAEGHGRTGLFTAALLVAQGHATSAEQALGMIQAKRSHVRLNKQQSQVLHAAVHRMASH